MRLGGRDQQADLIGTVAVVEVGERPLHCLDVGAGRFVMDGSSALKRAEQFARVSELRNDFGVGVRRRFHPRKPQGGETLDQRALGRGRHEAGLVLQAVAGEAFAERHVHG
jgi:hypothetical protein